MQYYAKTNFLTRVVSTRYPSLQYLIVINIISKRIPSKSHNEYDYVYNIVKYLLRDKN